MSTFQSVVGIVASCTLYGTNETINIDSSNEALKVDVEAASDVVSMTFKVAKITTNLNRENEPDREHPNNVLAGNSFTFFGYSIQVAPIALSSNQTFFNNLVQIEGKSNKFWFVEDYEENFMNPDKVIPIELIDLPEFEDFGRASQTYLIGIEKKYTNVS